MWELDTKGAQKDHCDRCSESQSIRYVTNMFFNPCRKPMKQELELLFHNEGIKTQRFNNQSKET